MQNQIQHFIHSNLILTNNLKYYGGRNNNVANIGYKQYHNNLSFISFLQVKLIYYLITMKKERQFVFFFHFTAWHHFSLGIHLDVLSPNIEIHIPFGFIKIGWENLWPEKPLNWDAVKKFDYGITYKYD